MHSTAVYLIGMHTHTNLIEIETKRETFETRTETVYITKIEKGIFAFGLSSRIERKK